MQSIPDVVSIGIENQLRDLDFTIDDVLKILNGLRSNKSPGPDRIHPCVLKECAASLALTVYLLFRQSMDEGHLPQTWKDSHITPIHKKGSRLQVGNYRPVSLTSVVCKSLEKLIRAALLKHMMICFLMCSMVSFRVDPSLRNWYRFWTSGPTLLTKGTYWMWYIWTSRKRLIRSRIIA